MKHHPYLLSPIKYSYFDERTLWKKYKGYIIAFLLTTFVLGLLLFSCRRGDEVFASEVKQLKASWYSRANLIRDGQDKITHFIMANGKEFKDENLTCATWLFPLGTWIRVTCISNNRSVVVKVSDRIGRRFALTRIDLSKTAFQKIANLKEGLTNVTVEVI